MKAVRLFCIVAAFIFQLNHLNAQPSKASERAITFADSLLKAFRQNHLDQYEQLCYPGVVKYYGGQKNFREYLFRARLVGYHDAIAKLKIIQMQNVRTEWQCVIEKVSECTLDGRKAHIISYLVGQSTDNGDHWKFVDVALNPSSNVVYIMPDIFETLRVPQRQVIYENNFVSKM